MNNLGTRFFSTCYLKILWIPSELLGERLFNELGELFVKGDPETTFIPSLDFFNTGFGNMTLYQYQSMQPH